MRVDGGIVAGDRNVDRHVNYNGSIHQRSEEISVAAVPGAVVTCVDQAGAGSRSDGDIPAQRGVSVPAITPDAGHLNGALIDIRIVRLISVGTGIGSRNRNVDRVIHYERCVNNGSVKQPVSAVAGLVTPCPDRTRIATAKSRRG